MKRNTLFAFLLPSFNCLYLFTRRSKAASEMKRCVPTEHESDWHWPERYLLEMCEHGFTKFTGITPVPGVIYEIRLEGIDIT